MLSSWCSPLKMKKRKKEEAKKNKEKRWTPVVVFLQQNISWWIMLFNLLLEIISSIFGMLLLICEISETNRKDDKMCLSSYNYYNIYYRWISLTEKFQDNLYNIAEKNGELFQIQRLGITPRFQPTLSNSSTKFDSYMTLQWFSPSSDVHRFQPCFNNIPHPIASFTSLAWIQEQIWDTSVEISTHAW